MPIPEIQVEGAREIAKLMKRLTKQTSAGKMRRLWSIIYKDFRKVEKKQFLSEGQFFGKGWKKLTPAYREIKEKTHPGKTILRRTDALFNSLTISRGQKSFFGTSAAQVEMGTDVTYAQFHQKPGKRRRVIFQFSRRNANSKALIDRWVRWIAAHLFGRI